MSDFRLPQTARPNVRSLADFTTPLDPSVLMDGWDDRVRVLQESGWWVRTTMGVAVLGYEQCRSLLQDTRFRNLGTDILASQGIDDGPIRRMYEGFLLSIEGERHRRIRSLLRAGFTREAIDCQRLQIRAVANGLLDRVANYPEFDFVTDIAALFPAQVFAEILGLSVSVDDEDFFRWCADFGYILGFQINEHRAAIEKAIEGLTSYILQAIAERRRNPQHDLISALLSAHAGNDGLSESEIVSAGLALLFGGFDTTRRTLGRAILVMLEHIEQWHLLGTRPMLAERATEEIFRYCPGTQVAIRVATRCLDFLGLPVEEGELLIAATGVANRDPSVFASPDVFDIGRTSPPVLTFGAGPHHCLGAYLARVELQEALPVFAARMPDLQLCGLVTTRSASAGSPGPTSIPVRSVSLQR